MFQLSLFYRSIRHGSVRRRIGNLRYPKAPPSIPKRPAVLSVQRGFKVRYRGGYSTDFDSEP